MLSKRAAIVALFSGVLAKMAHADDPNFTPMHVDLSTRSTWNDPTSWTVNLDQMTHLDVRLGGETVSISAAELFAALRST